MNNCVHNWVIVTAEKLGDQDDWYCTNCGEDRKTKLEWLEHGLREGERIELPLMTVLPYRAPQAGIFAHLDTGCGKFGHNWRDGDMVILPQPCVELVCERCGITAKRAWMDGEFDLDTL